MTFDEKENVATPRKRLCVDLEKKTQIPGQSIYFHGSIYSVAS